MHGSMVLFCRASFADNRTHLSAKRSNPDRGDGYALMSFLLLLCNKLRKGSRVSDLIKSEGLPFFAHLLARLSDVFVQGCDELYSELGSEVPPEHHRNRRNNKTISSSRDQMSASFGRGRFCYQEN